jgi:hypothetical protein
MTPNLGPRFGTPIWDPDLGPLFGPQVWTPILDPQYGPPTVVRHSSENGAINILAIFFFNLNSHFNLYNDVFTCICKM